MNCIFNSSSHEVASGSDIMPCIKIYKPLVVFHKFSKGMTPIAMLCIFSKILAFSCQNM